jgi:hypothetical protein
MLHPHSPVGPPQLAIPAIGFVQGAFGRDAHIEVPYTEDQRDGPPQLIDFLAAAFIIMAVTFGPVLVWLV